jgi:hypothetical protein
MVFETERTDKQSLYRRSLEVNVVISAVPKLMYWSDQAIGWDRADHPKIMPNPGGYALVMDPTFVGPANNVRFSKVLIDNGSSINVMYRDTMQNWASRRICGSQVRQHSMALCRDFHVHRWAKSRLMSCLATGITAEWRTSNLRW